MKLTPEEIKAKLAELAGWQITGEQLVREFKFRDFQAAFGFMASVALAAEKMGHHPDWSNSYNRVTVSLSTHSAGGLTDKDFDLAAHINRIAGADV